MRSSHNTNEISEWVAFGSRRLTLTHYYMEAEEMCRKMATNGSCRHACWRMCVYSLNAARTGTLLAFGVGYIRAYYSRQEQRQPLARYCLYLPASMDKHDKKKWLLVIVSGFSVNHQSTALASFGWDSDHPFPLVSMFPQENFTNDPLLLLIQTHERLFLYRHL